MISREKETSETILSEAKIRDLQEKENRNKRARKHVNIIGNSMVRNKTGPGMSKIMIMYKQKHTHLQLQTKS